MTLPVESQEQHGYVLVDLKHIVSQICSGGNLCSTHTFDSCGYYHSTLQVGYHWGRADDYNIVARQFVST